MSIDPALLAVMTVPMTLKGVASTDTFGNETYDADVAFTCYVDSDDVNLGESDRQDQKTGETVRQIIAIMGVTPEISPRDRIVYDSVNFNVTTVTVLTDEDGPHHQTVTMTSKIIT